MTQSSFHTTAQKQYKKVYFGELMSHHFLIQILKIQRKRFDKRSQSVKSFAQSEKLFCLLIFFTTPATHPHEHCSLKYAFSTDTLIRFFLLWI
jgi:hypothetical protein